MSEQWFLDLDGVRSGPYQTSEVMSLVAEGEILPHHQIAMDLKAQKWMTILEWRLNQNRSIEPKKESVSPAPSFSPSQEKPLTPAPTPKAPEPIAKAPEPPKTSEAIAFKEPVKEPTPPASAPSSGVKPKRDPMAEMFDMLQNTKQKREVKSQQSHAQAHAATQTTQVRHAPTPTTSTTSIPTPSTEKTPSSGGWGKTILIGLMITVIGFALGQFFQHQGQKSNDSPPTIISTPSTPSSGDSVTTKTTQENGKEIREVKTDKMTIRAQVPSPNSAGANPSPEHGKDMQDLKDLKKELMELKALKEEIRGNGGNPGPSNDSAPPPDQNKNMNHYDSNPNNPDAPADDSENPGAPNEDTHY